jgi:uncharacterized protein (DUF4415 family)
MTKFEDRGFNQLTTPATNEDGEVINLTEEFVQKAKRGFPWPEDHVKKVSVSMRLDDDLIRFLRSTGKGWQTRANQYLRGMMIK